MKREALRHSKVFKLAKALDIKYYSAIGILECIWNITAEEAPAGDIGKLEPEMLALQVGWERPAAELIQGLHDARLLDFDENHVAKVHDWSEHAPDQVHRKLARSGKYFIDGKKPNFSKLTADERKVAASLYRCARRAPIGQKKPPIGHAPYLTKPHQTTPLTTTPEVALVAADPPSASPAAKIFEHWKAVMGHPEARFTADRRRKTLARLREGYTVEQLCRAIEGCKRSEFHQGGNKDGKVYDDLELVCRDGKHVEQFMREHVPKTLADDVNFQAFLAGAKGGES